MEKIIGIRLAGHQLAKTAFSRPGELVAWMGAVQAQDYTMSKWALGVRLEEGNLAGVNEALQAGEIVRTHVMRPTWHFVAGKDLRWMLKLSAQRIRRAVDQWTKGSGLDIPESLYTKSNDIIARLLSGGGHLTKDELELGLSEAGISVADDRMRRYLLRAEVEGIVCSGGDKAGKPTYALLEELLIPVEDLSREEALMRLALCYFRSHSPATLKDFVWWSGLTTTEAKLAVNLADKELVKEHCGEQEFLTHISCREAGVPEVVHFLPPYDEYLISYKERHLMMDPVHFPRAFNKWGIFYPVILYNGRIIGNWNKAVKREKMSIGISLFGPTCGNRLEPELFRQAEARFRKFYE